MKWIFEQEIDKIDIDVEDAGAAVIATLYDMVEPVGSEPDVGLFVRLQSWDEKGAGEDVWENTGISHVDMKRILAAKRVRVTVEIED